MENILLCPQCLKDNLRRGETAKLICSECEITFHQNSSTFFYDFRSKAPSQGKGLLIEQEKDFYSNETFKNFVRAISLEKYKAIIELLEPETILDVGCGNGLFAESLREIFSLYIGFEPSDVSNEKGCLPPPADNIFLFHADVDNKLPLRDQSLDLVLFMGSYDHIPKPEGIIRDAWAKLKPEGHLMIIMSNYAFWVKNFINFLSGKELFKHDHEHYCVHSPESLKKEILNFIPEARLEMVYADDLFIPNLPKRISFFYFNDWWLCVLNRAMKFMVTSVLRLKNRGSSMIVLFKK